MDIYAVISIMRTRPCAYVCVRACMCVCEGAGVQASLHVHVCACVCLHEGLCDIAFYIGYI